MNADRESREKAEILPVSKMAFASISEESPAAFFSSSFVFWRQSSIIILVASRIKAGGLAEQERKRTEEI